MNNKKLIAEAREQAAYLRGVSRDGSMPYSGGLLEYLADALEAATRERDAAPDAATRERDAALELMNRHKCDEAAEAAYRRVEKLRARVSELEQRDGQQWPELVKAEAERDAALTAIERVRVLAFGHGKGAEDLPVDRDALKAALDGAPEPEEKP